MFKQLICHASKLQHITPVDYQTYCASNNNSLHLMESDQLLLTAAIHSLTLTLHFNGHFQDLGYLVPERLKSGFYWN